MKNKFYVFDLDGVIVCSANRLHLLPDWESYHAAGLTAEPVAGMTQFMRSLEWDHYDIIIVTAREEFRREATTEWLHRHEIVFHRLLMRGTGVKDIHQSKVSSLSHLSTMPQQDCLLWLDDNPTTVAFAQQFGFNAALVATR